MDKGERAAASDDDDGEGDEDDIHKGVHVYVCACAGQTEGGGGLGALDKEGKEIDLMKGARLGVRREQHTRIGRITVRVGYCHTTTSSIKATIPD